MRLVGCALLALLGSSGCRDDPHFLGLSVLCDERALDVCAARASGCCPTVPDAAACQASERQRCQERVDLLVREPTLDYDSVFAADRRSEAQRALSACEPAPSPASFFRGGLPLGTTCERGTQCASGLCAGAPTICSEQISPPLCE